MSDDSEKVPLRVSIGKVIANTAMVAGVAALGVAAISAFAPSLGANSPTPDGGGHNWISDSIDWIKNGKFTLTDVNPARTALFAGALGTGGYVLGSVMDKHAEKITDGQVAEENAQMRSGGFVAAEETKAIQGLMKARLVSTNPEYFAQMSGGRNV